MGFIWIYVDFLAGNEEIIKANGKSIGSWVPVSTTGPSGFFVVSLFLLLNGYWATQFCCDEVGRGRKRCYSKFRRKTRFYSPAKLKIVHHFEMKNRWLPFRTHHLLYRGNPLWVYCRFPDLTSCSCDIIWMVVAKSMGRMTSNRLIWKMKNVPNHQPDYVYIIIYLYITGHHVMYITKSVFHFDRGPFCKSLDVQKHWTCCPTMGNHNPRFFW